MNVENVRDWVIIVSGSLMVLVLFVTLIMVLVVGIAARGLIGVTKGVVKGQLSPTLDSARQVVDDIRGTTSFIADTTVSPIIRLYGLVTGIRRGLDGAGRAGSPAPSGLAASPRETGGRFMDETNDETTPAGEESAAEGREECGKRRCGCFGGLLSGAVVGGVLALAAGAEEERGTRAQGDD